MPLKKFALIALILILSGKLYSQQQTGDLGLFVGGNIPLTDYTKTYIFQSVSPSFGVYYRYNFNSRFSLRFNAIYEPVKASGELNFTPQQFNKQVFDFDALIEVNYLDFVLGVKEMKFSPFIFIGLGLVSYPGSTGGMVITPNIPIGLGVKYAITKRLAVGAEASLHKLFNDELDNLDNPYQSSGLINVNDYFHNNDWISNFGLTLTYKFYIGRKPCPAYNSIN